MSFIPPKKPSFSKLQGIVAKGLQDQLEKAPDEIETTRIVAQKCGIVPPQKGDAKPKPVTITLIKSKKIGWPRQAGRTIKAAFKNLMTGVIALFEEKESKVEVAQTQWPTSIRPPHVKIGIPVVQPGKHPDDGTLEEKRTAWNEALASFDTKLMGSGDEKIKKLDGRLEDIDGFLKETANLRDGKAPGSEDLQSTAKEYHNFLWLAFQAASWERAILVSKEDTKLSQQERLDPLKAMRAMIKGTLALPKKFGSEETSNANLLNEIRENLVKGYEKVCDRAIKRVELETSSPKATLKVTGEQIQEASHMAPTSPLTSPALAKAAAKPASLEKKPTVDVKKRIEVVMKELSSGKISKRFKAEIQEAVGFSIKEMMPTITYQRARATAKESAREEFSRLDKALFVFDKRLNYIGKDIGAMLLRETDHKTRTKMRHSLAATAVSLAREGDYAAAAAIHSALILVPVQRPIDRGYEKLSAKYVRDKEELDSLFSVSAPDKPIMEHHEKYKSKKRKPGVDSYTSPPQCLKKTADMAKNVIDSGKKMPDSVLDTIDSYLGAWGNVAGEHTTGDSPLSSPGGIFHDETMLGEAAKEPKDSDDFLYKLQEEVAPRKGSTAPSAPSPAASKPAAAPPEPKSTVAPSTAPPETATGYSRLPDRLASEVAPPTVQLQAEQETIATNLDLKKGELGQKEQELAKANESVRRETEDILGSLDPDAETYEIPSSQGEVDDLTNKIVDLKTEISSLEEKLAQKQKDVGKAKTATHPEVDQQFKAMSEAEKIEHLRTLSPKAKTATDLLQTMRPTVDASLPQDVKEGILTPIDLVHTYELFTTSDGLIQSAFYCLNNKNLPTEQKELVLQLVQSWIETGYHNDELKAVPIADDIKGIIASAKANPELIEAGAKLEESLKRTSEPSPAAVSAPSAEKPLNVENDILSKLGQFKRGLLGKLRPAKKREYQSLVESFASDFSRVHAEALAKITPEDLMGHSAETPKATVTEAINTHTNSSMWIAQTILTATDKKDFVNKYQFFTAAGDMLLKRGDLHAALAIATALSQAPVGQAIKDIGEEKIPKATKEQENRLTGALTQKVQQEVARTTEQEFDKNNANVTPLKPVSRTLGELDGLGESPTMEEGAINKNKIKSMSNITNPHEATKKRGLKRILSRPTTTTLSAKSFGKVEKHHLYFAREKWRTPPKDKPAGITQKQWEIIEEGIEMKSPDATKPLVIGKIASVDKANKILNEIATTEKTFSLGVSRFTEKRTDWPGAEGKDLTFFEALHEVKALNESDLETISRGWEELNVSARELSSILTIMDNVTEPADKLQMLHKAFASKALKTQFAKFAELSLKYDETLKKLTEATKKGKGKLIADKFEVDGKGLGWLSVFITPIQRPPRYVLFMKEVAKRCEGSNFEEVLQKPISAMTDEINELKRAYG